MPHASIPFVAQYLRRWSTQAHDPSPDHELLQRFIALHDEAAFAALVQRHAALVLRLCRSLLGNSHDAEDVFQAVFLVLARKAASIRKGEALGSWLYAVAYRLSHKTRLRADKQRRCEQQAARPVQQTPMDEVTWSELRDVLHEEVSRLPEKYRVAVVLCYWQSHTHEQAAQQLGCARGTIKDRLERGRELLRKRLARRGLALSAAWFASSLSAGSPAVSAELLWTTVRGAILFSLSESPLGVVSASALASARAFLNGALVGKVKVVLALLLMLGVLGGGAGLAMLRAPDPPPASRERERPQTHRQNEPLPAGAIQRWGTLRFRHGDPVRCIALGPDDKSVLSASGKFVYVWDLATGKARRRLEGHTDEVNSVACSRDGKCIASLSADGMLHLWDAATGRSIRRIRAFKPSVNSFLRSWQWPGYSGLAFTPDGRRILCRGSDQIIGLWEVDSGEKKRELNTFSLLEMGRDPAVGFMLSPDGKILACLEGNLNLPRLKLRDPATGRRLKGPMLKDPVYGTVFSPDSKIMAFSTGKANAPCELVLWDVVESKKIRSFPLPEGEFRPVGFTPDGKSVVVKGIKALRFRDVETGKIVGRLQEDQPIIVNQLLFCRDGKTLVSYSHREHALRLWDRASGKELHAADGPRGAVRCVFSPDGRYLACGSQQDGTLYVEDVIHNREAARIQQKQHLSALQFSADSRFLAATSGFDPIIHVWEVAGGKEKRQIKMPVRDAERMAWSSDGKWLATWTFGEPFIRLWDAAAGKEVRRLNGRDGSIAALLFSPDSKTLAAAFAWDVGELLAWDVDTGQRRTNLEARMPVGLKSLAFSPDGRTVAAGALDGTICLWELLTGRKRATWKVQENFTSLAYSPDGKGLAAASNWTYRHSGEPAEGVFPQEGKPQVPRVRLWDVLSEEELPALKGHQGSISSLCFSPDGKRLATGSNDTTVLLWDATRWPIRKPAGKELSPAQLQSLWKDLGDTDASKAYCAIRTLAAAPKPSAAFLKQHLRPISPADGRTVARLLADLDSDRFETREQAVQHLEKLGDGAAGELHRALANKPPLEVRRRIEQLLEKLRGPGHVRQVRALEALEQMNPPEAREVCAALAKGVAEAPLTAEARATLQRLGKSSGTR